MKVASTCAGYGSISLTADLYAEVGVSDSTYLMLLPFPAQAQLPPCCRGGPLGLGRGRPGGPGLVSKRVLFKGGNLHA